jgi:hypothetical protein
MTGDDIDKWIDATLEGWDPSKEGWGPSEFDDVEAGPPLSIDELKRAHEDLAVWHSPLDFRRTVARLHKRCRSSEIFNDPKRKFLLDAWVVAELSKHKPFTRLRLAGEDERWPDGCAQTETGELKIEVTSALLPVAVWAQNINCQDESSMTRLKIGSNEPRPFQAHWRRPSAIR